MNLKSSVQPESNLVIQFQTHSRVTWTRWKMKRHPCPWRKSSCHKKSSIEQISFILKKKQQRRESINVHRMPPPSKVCMNSINNCFGHISMDKCGEERWVRDQAPQKLLSSNWIFQPFADIYIEKTSILIYLFIRSNFPYINYFVVGIDWNGIKLNSQQQLRSLKRQELTPPHSQTHHNVLRIIW